MILAAKCSPDEVILSDVCRAGLGVVELHLTEGLLDDVKRIAKLCGSFPLRYAVHAPNEGYAMKALAELVKEIEAEVVVFHNNYWEDEWADIVKIFKGVPCRLCIENIYSANEPVKFMRRYGIGRCMDLEHLQMQGGGIYEEGFMPIMAEASHVHLTGYYYGSSLWHTHIHYSSKHNSYILNLLKSVGYSGFVVSEAKISLQTYAEFKGLNEFFKGWESGKNI